MCILATIVASGLVLRKLKDSEGDGKFEVVTFLFAAIFHFGLAAFAATTRRISVQLFVERVTASSMVVCEYAAYLHAGNDRIEKMCQDSFALVMVPEPIYSGTIHLNAVVYTGAGILVATWLFLIFQFTRHGNFSANVARMGDAMSAGLNAIIQVSAIALIGLPSIALLATLALCRMNIDALGHLSKLSFATAILYTTLFIVLLAQVAVRLEVNDDTARCATLLLIGLAGYDVLGTLVPHCVAHRELVSPAVVARVARVAKVSLTAISYVLLYNYVYYLD